MISQIRFPLYSGLAATSVAAHKLAPLEIERVRGKH